MRTQFLGSISFLFQSVRTKCKHPTDFNRKPGIILLYVVQYRIKYILMIKAVLLSRLAMTQDSIRNTHAQMLWEKGFRGETLPVLVTKYGQNVIPKTHVTLH